MLSLVVRSHTPINSTVYSAEGQVELKDRSLDAILSAFLRSDHGCLNLSEELCMLCAVCSKQLISVHEVESEVEG